METAINMSASNYISSHGKYFDEFKQLYTYMNSKMSMNVDNII